MWVGICVCDYVHPDNAGCIIKRSAICRWQDQGDVRPHWAVTASWHQPRVEALDSCSRMRMLSCTIVTAVLYVLSAVMSLSLSNFRYHTSSTRRCKTSWNSDYAFAEEQESKQRCVRVEKLLLLLLNVGLCVWNRYLKGSAFRTVPINYRNYCNTVLLKCIKGVSKVSFHCIDLKVKQANVKIDV